MQIKKIKEMMFSNKKIHIIFFIILFFIIFGVLYFITLPIDLSKSYSIITSVILTNLDINNFVFYNGLNYGLQISEMQINILDVCTGLFELCVFLALILANLLINWKYKLYGVLIFVILFLIFNLIRILLMIYLLSNVNIFVVDILHTIIFKLGFFLFFLYFYYVWLTVSEDLQKRNKNK